MDATASDKELTRARTIATYALRVQFYELDAVTRGVTVFHRQGNIIGNGESGSQGLSLMTSYAFEKTGLVMVCLLSSFRSIIC